jgi:hypothetical protein
MMARGDCGSTTRSHVSAVACIVVVVVVVVALVVSAQAQEPRRSVYTHLAQWARDNGAIFHFDIRQVSPSNWSAFTTRSVAV